MTAAVSLVVGLLLLYLGAEWLVKGSTGLARLFGIRPFIIGLTLVAYGPSMPEIIVSSLAALEGKSDIALGNVIGSNIANIGLILGVTALITPIPVEGRLIWREIPALLVTAIAVPIALLDGTISRLEGSLLLLGAVGFTVFAIRGGREATGSLELVEADAEKAGAPAGGGKLRLTMIGLVGLVVLLIGGRVFVDGATGLALAFGISECVVGLTIVAIGTSAPELAASVVAAMRGHPGIAVGNVVGSNICNVLFVLGGAGLIRPISGDLRKLWLDTAALIFFTVLGALMVRTERRMTRVEGLVLVIAYAAFLFAVAT
jgi:cation:H+ antiporter